MWYDKYIGIPYKELGRDENGLDCYGLCHKVYKDELGITIPDYFNIGFYKSQDKEEQEAIKKGLHEFILQEAENNWEEVPLDKIKEFDVVLFRMCGYVIHIAVALNKDTFLHCFNGTECCVERVFPKWTGRLYKAYRWQK
ncbi:MAG: NlpC/P60 family protein [Clostridium sp.]|nr:NlpC/P60 family protein [Clostridium sp.]